MGDERGNNSWEQLAIATRNERKRIELILSRTLPFYQKIEISETLYPKKKKYVFRVDWSHNKKIKLFENILPDKQFKKIISNCFLW